MIEIYLNTLGSQVPIISIPNYDVQRLSKCPFKWLRYVMFSICGARGELSPMPDGPPVDYGYDGLLTDVIYYYNPSENCIFVDCEVINEESEQCTSTTLTDCAYKFREDIIQRDGSLCIVTQAEFCDAAHLIPRCKGDEYIKQVVQDRHPHYDCKAPSISGIDDVKNGVFLDKTLHAMLTYGHVAFLKTPNYGLEPDDIQRFDEGPECTDHITLQRLKKAVHDDPIKLATFKGMGGLHPQIAFPLGAHIDALFQGTGSSLPHTIILDYAYGVAAYNCWRSTGGQGEGHCMMKNYHKEHYANIPMPPRWPSEGNSDNSYCSRPRHNKSMKRGERMAEAMDHMSAVLMALQPREVAIRREKQMQEEELKVQEASRIKVVEWMNTLSMSAAH